METEMNTLTATEQNYTAHRNTYFNSRLDWVAAMDLLIAMGWTWDRDTRISGSGWFIHPEHETKCRPTGDSKPMAMAALNVAALYTDITPDQIQSLSRQYEREEQARRYRQAGYAMAAA
jgi:hypothetical protein